MSPGASQKFRVEDIYCLHAQLSRATVKAWLGLQLDYCPCLSVQALRENRLTDSLSDSSPVGGDMCHSAGCNWTFFRLAKQATNKLASSYPCWTVKTWTTLQHFVLHIYALLLVQIRCTLPLVLMGFLFSCWPYSTNLCCVKDCRRDYRPCADCLGQSGSDKDVHMQE